jgi:hypothetical protein
MTQGGIMTNRRRECFVKEHRKEFVANLSACLCPRCLQEVQCMSKRQRHVERAHVHGMIRQAAAAKLGHITPFETRTLSDRASVMKMT